MVPELVEGTNSHSPDEKNTFSVNVFEGDDYMRYWYNHQGDNKDKKYSMTDLWGNILASATWDRVVSRYYVQD